jgi:hypothetical protein
MEMSNMVHDEELLKECFEFLDALRESGVTNMYGCGPYLQEEFELSKYEARSIALAWMEQYGK